MKNLMCLFSILLIIPVMFTGCQQDEKDLTQEDRYLGFTPPDRTSLLFAPGIVSTEYANEYGITFSTDFKEIYFKRVDSTGRKNMMIKYNNGEWGDVLEAPLPKEGRYGELHISPIGNFMLANKILQDAEGNINSTIVKLIKKGNEWKEDELLFDGMRATSTMDGNIYVTKILSIERSLGIIVHYKYENGVYSGPVELGNGINLPGISSAHPLIAPDESFLIFNSRREPGDRGSLYISFKNSNDQWTEPANLSKRLDTEKQTNHWIASLSPDGKYLFYNIGRNIYWVNASFIEELKPDVLR